MRKALLSSVVLVTLVMFSGCTLNHDFSFDIDKTFNVVSGVTTYTETQMIDPTSNNDFNNNKDKISAIHVESASWTIESATALPGQTVTASIQVADANGTLPMQTLVSPTTATIVAGTTGPLPVDNAVAGTLSNWLKNTPNKATAKLTATTNTAPSNFVFRVRLHVTATYSASLFSFL